MNFSKIFDFFLQVEEEKGRNIFYANTESYSDNDEIKSGIERRNEIHESRSGKAIDGNRKRKIHSK